MVGDGFRVKGGRDVARFDLVSRARPIVYAAVRFFEGRRHMPRKRIRIRIEYDETDLPTTGEISKAKKVEDGCFEIDFDRDLELDIDTNDKALAQLGYAAMRDVIAVELAKSAKKKPSAMPTKLRHANHQRDRIL